MFIDYSDDLPNESKDNVFSLVDNAIVIDIHADTSDSLSRCYCQSEIFLEIQ